MVSYETNEENKNSFLIELHISYIIYMEKKKTKPLVDDHEFLSLRLNSFMTAFEKKNKIKHFVLTRVDA